MHQRNVSIAEIRAEHSPSKSLPALSECHFREKREKRPYNTDECDRNRCMLMGQSEGYKHFYPSLVTDSRLLLA